MKVILVMAMTIDGKTARNSMEPVDWTGKADKKRFVQITKDAGAVIMGSATFATIGHMLKDRKNIVMTRNPSRFDNDCPCSGHNAAGRDNSGITLDTGIASCKSHSDRSCPEFTDKIPAEILKSLENEGFESVAVIGGSIINGLFAKENLIDELYITIIPKIFGKGLPLLSCETDMNLELAEMERIDSNSVLLKYNVIR